MCPARTTRARSRHDEPLFPTEVMFHSQPVAWVLARDARRRAGAAPRACRSSYEPLPAILTIEQAIEAGSFLTEPLRLARGDMSALASSPLRIDGELTIGGQEHFYLETQASIAWLDESGGVVGALVHAASVRDAGDRRARARRAAAPGDGRVPAHGRRVRRQGSAGQRLGGRRGARRVEDAAPGARAADARSSTWRSPASGIRSWRATRPGFASDGRIAGAAAGALLGRRLEPRSVRADHVARAVPLRQRLPPAGGRRDRPRVPDAQDVADRVPRLRRTAGHARHRGDPARAAAAARRCPRTSSASATSTARATRRTTASAVEQARAHRRHLDAAEGHEPTSTSAARPIARVQRALTRTSSAASRSRR